MTELVAAVHARHAIDIPGDWNLTWSPFFKLTADEFLAL